MKIFAVPSQSVPKGPRGYAAGVYSAPGSKPLSDAALKGFAPTIQQALRAIDWRRGFESKRDQVFFSLLSSAQPYQAVVLIGLGDPKRFNLERCRRAVAQAAQVTRRHKLDRLALALDTFTPRGAHPVVLGQAAAEALQLSEYRFDKYRTNGEKPTLLSEVSLVSDGPAAKLNGWTKGIEQAAPVVEAVRLARDIINEPANVMTPARMAQIASEQSRRAGLRCEVLGLAQLRALKMNGVLAVSQGSRQEPKFLILKHHWKEGAKPVVIVGKGITFDTGGISIKPSKDMHKMKYDMSGAAAVIGTLLAASRLKLNVPVVGLAPLCENMPGGNAQRPGDIIKMHSGKTVEVLNTDAEGRLVLADALSFAKKFKPRAVIDLATLTGACLVALGDKAMGLMSNNSALAKKIAQAGEAVGERCWELPMYEEYSQQIKSDVADLANVGDGNAGTITAAKFLEAFTDYPWVHLDIAGLAWAERPQPYVPKGAVGVGIRLLIEYLKTEK